MTQINKITSENDLSLYDKFMRINWGMFILLLSLVLFGCLALYSAAGAEWNPWAIRHLQRSIIGVFIAIFIAFTDIRIIYKYAWVPFFISSGHM